MNAIDFNKKNKLQNKDNKSNFFRNILLKLFKIIRR